MNIHKTTCVIALSMAAALPLTAHAHTVSPQPQDLIESNFSDVLYPKARLNKNLDAGEYDFVGLHGKQGKTFADEWKFTLADTADVAISLTDYSMSFGGISYLSDDKKGRKHKNSSGSFLLDNKFLTFSLFDADDHLLGTAGENGTITALGLEAGEWYTVTVSAKVNGVFGSAYRGALTVAPTAVPLGDTLPFFGTALVALTIARRRKAIAS